MAGCRQLLMATETSRLQNNKPVIAIKDSATVAEALKALSDAGILSAPIVLAPEGEKTESPLWEGAEPPEDITGFIDVRDVLSNFLREVSSLELSTTKSLLQRMRMLEERGAAFSDIQIKHLHNIGQDGDFLHLTQAKISLLELISQGMLQPKLRSMHGGETVSCVVHRIALFNSHGAITDIISQSDIIRFLAEHPKEMGSLGSTTMAELGFCHRHVESITPAVSVLEAMKLILDKSISSLAVVGPDGVIMGNFSVSDLRSIMAEQFGALALPVGDFLAHEHGMEYAAHNHHKAPEHHHHRAVAASAAADPEGDPGCCDSPRHGSHQQPHQPHHRPGSAGPEDVSGSAGHQFVESFRARLKQSRATAMAGEEFGQALALARADTTLVEVMAMMAQQRVHRVYVVDDGMRPFGIVTCTDVLRKIIQSTS